MNEPAFPNEGFSGWGEPFQGMTLRDYFAAKAMQGFAAMDDDGFPSIEKMAEVSYEWADAMLKARESK